MQNLNARLNGRPLHRTKMVSRSLNIPFKVMHSHMEIRGATSSHVYAELNPVILHGAYIICCFKEYRADFCALGSSAACRLIPNGITGPVSPPVWSSLPSARQQLSRDWGRGRPFPAQLSEITFVTGVVRTEMWTFCMQRACSASALQASGSQHWKTERVQSTMSYLRCFIPTN